jgi:hypothetical protein
MKPAKTPKKVAKAPAAAKQLNVNLAYVDEIADESIATFMALRALIHRQADEIANLRAQLEDRK